MRHRLWRIRWRVAGILDQFHQHFWPTPAPVWPLGWHCFNRRWMFRDPDGWRFYGQLGPEQ